MVSPFSSRISDVVSAPLSLPPIKTIPCGEAQELCIRLFRVKLWDWTQEPVLERVWQDVLAGES